MNRRGFFSSLARGLAAISILPAATTYARSRWVATTDPRGRWVRRKDFLRTGAWELNPEWVNAPYEMRFRLAKGVWQRVDDIDGIHCIADPYPMRYNSPEPGAPAVPLLIEV